MRFTSLVFLLMIMCCGQARGQEKFEKIYGSLAKFDARLSDYKLFNKKNLYKIKHRSLPIKINSQQAENYLSFEERISDSDYTKAEIVVLENSATRLRCAVIFNYCSDLEQENDIIIWEKQGKIWTNISKSTLPHFSPAANFDDCPISVRQLDGTLPFRFAYCPTDQIWTYQLDREALEMRCQTKRAEQPSSGNIPICNVLECASETPQYFIYRQNEQNFERLEKKSPN